MPLNDNLRRTNLLCALLVLVTLAAYWPVFQNGFILYDDPLYVTSNSHVLGGLTWRNISWAFQTGYGGNWHPLTWLSHMLDVQLFGLRPGWHHFSSLLFHCANAVLLFLWLLRASRAFWRSAMVGALFAVHPLHVESVAWVAERKDVLSTFFFLLTLLAYTRYVELKQPTRPVSQPPRADAPESTGIQGLGFAARASSSESSRRLRVALYYGLSLVLFALGLMSKPMLVTLPFLLLLLDFWPFGRLVGWQSPLRMKTLIALFSEKIPFFILAFGVSLVTLRVQNEGGTVTISIPWAVRSTNAVAAYMKYLGKAVWPANLSIFYPHPYINSLSPPAAPLYLEAKQWPLGMTLGAALFLLVLSVFALARVKRLPWFGMGWFWYLGTLVPVIGLVQAGSQSMADRYTYVPLIGIFLILAWTAWAVFRQQTWSRTALGVGAFAVLAVCVGATLRQTTYWRTDLALFEHALAVNPNNATAHCHVGAALARDGKMALALPHFQAALAAEPNSADALYYLGLTYEHQEKTNVAFEYYQKAVRQNPRCGSAHVHLGILLRALGQSSEALKHFGQALGLNPDDPDARYFLGRLLAENGDFEEAEQQFNVLIQLKPQDPEARRRLGEVLLRENKSTEAEAQFQKLTRLDPNDPEARISLAKVLLALGRVDEALFCYQDAVHLSPDNPATRYDFGTVLLAGGRLPEAEAQFNEALRLKPNFPEALSELGTMAIGTGKTNEGVARFREAVQFCPTNANFQINLGNALMLAGETNEARTAFATALALQPDLPEKLVIAGKTLAGRGEPNAAIARFRTALALKPDWPVALNNLAWMLATHPQAQVRNGAEAVRLAERACALSAGKEGRYWSTLAAAYAESGRFTDAVSTAEKGRSLSLAAGDKEAAQAAEARLSLYRRQQPYHQQ